MVPLGQTTFLAETDFAAAGIDAIEHVLHGHVRSLCTKLRETAATHTPDWTTLQITAHMQPPHDGRGPLLAIRTHIDVHEEQVDPWRVLIRALADAQNAARRLAAIDAADMDD